MAPQIGQSCAGLALGQLVLSWKVFDVQRKVTYKNLNSWYKELREFRPEIPCIVVANKIDGECAFCPQLARVVMGFAHVLTENQCPSSVGCTGFPQGNPQDLPGLSSVLASAAVLQVLVLCHQQLKVQI